MTAPQLPRSLYTRLRSHLPAGALLTSPAECLSYAYDNSAVRGLPAAVALPERSEQVVEIVRACRAHALPIVARGRGSNTTGASVPLQGGLVLSFERMRALRALHVEDRIAIVEPGLLNAELQQAAAAHRLFWPPDPTSAAFSSIGGNLACNAGGPRAVKYGACRDNVLGLCAVTGAGELIRCGGSTSKLATGYDFTRFIVGSEGTLALIVEATLALRPLPLARRVLRALYRNVEAAAMAVARLMTQPQTPSMLEFMDATCVRLAREVGGVDLPAAGALLMIEADGDPDTLASTLAVLERAAHGPGTLAIDVAADETAGAGLWAARKALSPALRSLAAGKINEDVVVPISRIPALCAAVADLASRFDLEIVNFGHIGNGNLHVNVLYDPADAAQSRRAQAVLPELFATVLALGGSLSGEHGIGVGKREFMAAAHGPEALTLMRAVKAQFDPDGILNPGKLLPA